MSHPAAPRTIARALLALAALACAPRERSSAPPAPRASFLVAAGDSTFWVESDSGGVRVRRSPILLTELDGSLHELYLTDDDRSYFDAVILAQRIYRRDVARGDSVLLWEDSTLAAIARRYAAEHPQELPLGPDEEASDDPSIHAATDTELLDAMGAFLLYEQHVDIDESGGRDQHETRRGVLDVRSGRAVTVADLVGATQAEKLFRQAQLSLRSAIDSIRRASDERARRAASALAGFTLDERSFALVESEGAPAIAFLVPGRGAEAGGYALPLAPLPITAGPWWTSIREALPATRPDGATWRGADYDVLAREDSAGESAVVSVGVAPDEWPLARVPLPVRRVHRLDSLATRPELLAGLRRAFDDAARFSGEVRTAARAPARPLARLASSRAQHTPPSPRALTRRGRVAAGCAARPRATRDRYELPLDADAPTGVLAGSVAPRVPPDDAGARCGHRNGRRA